jgi:hypothetical protein
VRIFKELAMLRTKLNLITTLIFAAIVGTLLSACGGGGSGSGSPPPPVSYDIGGTVSGLTSALGGSLVLQDNGAGNLPVQANGSFTFAAALASGSSYAVTVATQPTGQTCTVAAGTGTATAAVTNVAVTCSIIKFNVGGNINGLSGSGLVLANGSDTVSPSAGATSFTFSTQVPYAGSYSVTVSSQPTGQTCTVAAGSGTVTGAVTSVAVSCVTNPATITGMVLKGGAQGVGVGVGGETVTLYDAMSPTGGMGAGSQAAILSAATTATDGSFSVPVPSQCPNATGSAYDVVYVVASPGPKAAGSPIRFASVLGTSCAALIASTSPSVGVINELTTIGTAYAFNWFTNYNGNIGVANSQPANGLQVAVATYEALVDISTGAVTSNLQLSQVPATQTLNALANSFAACTITGNAGSSACNALFAATTLPVLAPSDTLDAALNIAGYPGLLGNLYAVAASAPFAPTLSAAPNDWALVQTFQGGGLSNPLGLAIGTSGDIWVVNNPVGGGAANGSNGSLSIFGSTGNALNNFGITTPSTFYGPERIAIGVDNTGVESGWITNMPQSYQASGAAGPGRVIQFELSATLSNCAVSSATCTLAYAPGSTGYVGGINAGFAQPQGLAIDSSGNAWIASLYEVGSSYAPPGNTPGVVTEIADSLAASTPLNDAQDSNTNNGGPQYQDVGIDGQGTIWVLDGADGLLQEYNPSSSAWLNGAGFATGFDMGFGVNPGFAPQVGNQLAIDLSGNIWVAQSSNTGGKLPGFNSSGILPNLLTEPDLQAPNAIAIDGNGSVFVVNTGSGSCLVEIGIMQGGSARQDLSYNPGTQSICGLGNSSFYDTYGLAIDQAGNLWAVNYDGPSGGGSLVEVVGAAFPTVTPLYQASKGGSPAMEHRALHDRLRR